MCTKGNPLGFFSPGQCWSSPSSKANLNSALFLKKNLKYAVSKDRKSKLINLSSINGATATVKLNDRLEKGENKQFHNLCTVAMHTQQSQKPHPGLAQGMVKEGQEPVFNCIF